MTKIDNLLQAINLANYEGLDSVEVTIDDLLLLREEVFRCQAIEEQLRNDKHLLQMSLAKSELQALDKPIKLNVFC